MSRWSRRSITHQGDIRTDGTAALVAAEAATINFNPDGLFDIAVTVGTDAPTASHIDGGTIDRNSEARASQRSIAPIWSRWPRTTP